MRNGSKNKNEMTKPNPIEVEASSGNVFADLGLPDPDLALAKAELVNRIRHLIDDRRLTQAKAAELLGLDQPKISALIRGRVSGYSLDRLFRLLNALGQSVEIHVRPAKARRRLDPNRPDGRTQTRRVDALRVSLVPRGPVGDTNSATLGGQS